jgi:trans-L-3-hydroxyproline dehydratase
MEIEAFASDRLPPDRKGWQVITTLDMHTGGEPLRIVTGGLPPIEGRTVLERRRFFRDNLDHIRTALMWEPRGHADMYGAVVTPSQEADFDVFFLHNEGYSTMCGHAVIALTKLAAEMGLGREHEGWREVTIGVPAGRITARAEMHDGLAVRSFFRNVPSFVLLRDQEIEVAGVGRVRFDVAYGGAFYAFVDATQLELPLTPDQVQRHIDLGRRIKQAVVSSHRIEHPLEEDLSFLYGTIFTGPAIDADHHSRNVCVFADGEIDRSATGSGVSARAALHHARGELGLGQSITIESIIGTTMTVAAVEETMFGPHRAIIPEVSGTASYTGRHEFLIDPEDRLRTGFLVR